MILISLVQVFHTILGLYAIHYVSMCVLPFSPFPGTSTDDSSLRRIQRLGEDGVSGWVEMYVDSQFNTRPPFPPRSTTPTSNANPCL